MAFALRAFRPMRWVLLSVLGLALLVAMPAPAMAAAKLAGSVQSGEKPIGISTVTLYLAHNDSSLPAQALGKARTDPNGSFEIAFTRPANANAVLYLIASGGSLNPTRAAKSRHAIRLMTVLPPGSNARNVVLNERTTVASAFALAQFLSKRTVAGNSPGMENAAATAQNLVNLADGEIGQVLGSSPNGLETSTMSEFNSLANMLAACIRASKNCKPLFQLALAPDGTVPGNTLQAVLNIAHSPWQNVAPLFEISKKVKPEVYQPALRSAPDAWTLAVKYVGNGQEFDGPGNMAVDKDGSVWISNNYEFNADPHLPACGGKELLKLTPTGQDAPGAPFKGGGINGVGFGITIDLNGDVWAGNFGFKGLGCQNVPPANSVSKFSPSGAAISPDSGYLQGPISEPQAVVADQAGNIWIANCGSGTITKYVAGNPGNAVVYSDTGDANLPFNKPFDIAIDGFGRAWISSTGNDSIVALNADGTPLPGSPFTGGGIFHPLGVAVDSLGNVWVANSGMELPCPHTQVPQGGRGVTLLAPDGQPASGSPFMGGGLSIPWGIAVDGKDNVWVAEFSGQRLVQLCGARPENCPQGYKTGDPISPPTGYTSDALQRNTGIVIDASGNVWVANNWRRVPIQTNPGGDGMVVYIGAAAPVKTPLLGPPQQP